jgi:hypothetical protein
VERSRLYAILGAAAGLAMILVTVILLTRPGTSARPALSAEQKAYLAQIEITGARLSVARNIVGDTVTYLDASVTNKGARLVRRLEIQLEFHDIFNQVVLRETAHPIPLRAAPLKPGETRAFRVAFDHMPADWNRTLPTMTTTDVRF